MQDTRCGNLTHLQRSSRCILQNQPTLPQDTRKSEISHLCREVASVFCGSRRLGLSKLVEVVHLCREAVGVFCRISRLGHRSLVGVRSYSFAEKQPVYSAALADWATVNLLWKSYTSAGKQPVYSTTPAYWAIKKYVIILTTPFARAGNETRSIFKRSLTGLNSEFSFSKTSCLTKAEESSLLIAGGRIIGFIPFSRVLAQCEMQSVSSRIWTRVAVSISYDDSHYTMGTSTKEVRYCLFIVHLHNIMPISWIIFITRVYLYLKW